MKTQIRLILFLLILLPSFSIGQSITENLNYINDQFSLYNDYETSFSVDMKTKELICEDKFGVLKAYSKDVEIRTSGSNVGIYCLSSSSECIRYYDKSGMRKHDENHSDYTMGLRENGEIIPHIKTVLDKFDEIKRMIAAGISSYGNSNNLSVESKINTELNTINEIFQRGSEYKNVYSVDFSKKKITARTKSCQAIVPVKSGLSVNYYKRDGTYGEGFYFENSDKSILETCTNFEDYTDKTYEYLSSYNDAQTVIRSLKNIIDLLENNSVGDNSHSAMVDNSSTDELLRYINEQFSNFNAYNTVYSIDYSSKKLIYENDFGVNYVSFKDLEVRADYENGWIGIYCLSGEECILQKTTSGSTTYYDKYTMSLNQDGKMISHMSEVIRSFAELKTQVLRGAKPTSNNSSSDNDDSDDPDK